ncbi:hypothetical protein [Burkholderia multivorans]
MMNGGNILTLQRILGHSSLQMTMRYSHLAPDHLKEATRLNPLVSLSNRESVRTQNSTTHQNTDGFETRDVTQLERPDQVNEHCEHAPVRADVSADGPAHTG